MPGSVYEELFFQVEGGWGGGKVVESKISPNAKKWANRRPTPLINTALCEHRSD